ncbi:MAG TPA: 50S ribosomal protein L18 [Rhodospirillaceae bacterium]|jgi:large subunit ribosomal protein L18|nr:50S ribosomal protein L18 [Alphaproteobacteria bacterium]HBH27190.1 50S ribosomal protein L18 [Rhodospirillaceae bacterium]
MAQTHARTKPAQRRAFRTRSAIRRVNIDRNARRPVRPRLSVHRTGRHIYAQIIDDLAGRTLAAASTLEPAGRESGKGWAVEAAREVGKRLAERARAAGVEAVVFDRGRFLYHGRVRAVAEGAREGGLNF